MGDMAGLEPGIGTSYPKDSGFLAFDKLRILRFMFLEISLPEYLISFKQFINHSIHRHGIIVSGSSTHDPGYISDL